MTLSTIPLPFGLRDVKVTPYGGAPADAVDLPNARTFSFSESEDFEELRGDDGVAATHGSGPSVDWDLEGGGISFEAVQVMFGGTITESGVAPDVVKTYSKTKNDQRPYFKTEGQAISDSGGDFHIVLPRCKATGDLSGDLSDGAFWLTGASGQALSDPAQGDKVWDFVQNETETAIVTT